MMRLVLTAVILAAAATCRQAQERVIDVYVRNIKAHGSCPTIAADTNLPEHFTLAIDIMQLNGVPLNDGFADVNHGRLTWGPFSQGGRCYLAGQYKLVFQSVVADLQAPSAQSAIGPDGMWLHGPQTAPGLIGGRDVRFQTFVLIE